MCSGLLLLVLISCCICVVVVRLLCGLGYCWFAMRRVFVVFGYAGCWLLPVGVWAFWFAWLVFVLVFLLRLVDDYGYWL